MKGSIILCLLLVMSCGPTNDDNDKGDGGKTAGEGLQIDLSGLQPGGTGGLGGVLGSLAGGLGG